MITLDTVCRCFIELAGQTTSDKEYMCGVDIDAGSTLYYSFPVDVDAYYRLYDDSGQLICEFSRSKAQASEVFGGIVDIPEDCIRAVFCKNMSVGKVLDIPVAQFMRYNNLEELQEALAFYHISDKDAQQIVHLYIANCPTIVIMQDGVYFALTQSSNDDLFMHRVDSRRTPVFEYDETTGDLYALTANASQSFDYDAESGDLYIILEA